MNLPTLNINEIPNLDVMVGTLGNSLDTLSNVSRDEILLIFATYLFESGSIASMIF